jgi:erythromycin esterase-like protein
MASNIDWILQQNPGQKIVLWAHYAHVSRIDGFVGSYIAANHGTDYVAFGQIFHDGLYNASMNGRVGPHAATPSFSGTVEYVFHCSGLPQFMLDMRRASPDDPGSSWLLGESQYRTIGAVATDGFIFTLHLAKDYDVLIFFDQTNPSKFLTF